MEESEEKVVEITEPINEVKSSFPWGGLLFCVIVGTLMFGGTVYGLFYKEINGWVKNIQDPHRLVRKR